MSHKSALALFALAVIMLVGCKQPVGLPNNDVHAATTHTVYATTNALINPTGHIDLYQYGELSSQVYLTGTHS
ncbi:hypothetical protein FJY68_11520 [candidate division WOR-3 bacterium]|uniref:Uncharacterized protein n=1 Tax=candidate division WOR-3 bacterium TaxID=2052148 RepID=A0A937XJW2_UNCW3|nr:hypothetical protein [candidate division WOR-3 bacterium]